MDRSSKCLTALALATVLNLGALVAPTVAHAATTLTDDTVTAADVAVVVRTAGLSAESTGVQTTTDVDSAAVVSVGGSTTDVPRDPADGVDIGGGGGPTLTVTPPDAGGASDGKVVAPGVVAYANDNGSATAVQAEADGATRFLTVIANSDAPTSYAFNVTVPGGGHIELYPTGAAAILSADGALVSVVDAPWAKDANDVAVPTHFVTDGQTLTQVVEHHIVGVAYPVTADPRFSANWSGVTITFDRYETGDIAIFGTAALGWRVGGPWAAGISAAGGNWLARQAQQRGLCLAVWKSSLYLFFVPYITKC